ncbi:MAG: hypothetical protein AB7I37_27250, partial [Pirellulales bacterium]
MKKYVQIFREKVLAPRTLKWTAGVLAVAVPGTVAAVNLPKLWNKPAAVAAAEGEGEEAKSAAAKDPFESGSFSKKLDKPTMKFDIDRYYQSFKSASRDPYDAAPPEPAK